MRITIFGEKHCEEGKINIVRTHITGLIKERQINVLFIEYAKVVQFHFNGRANDISLQKMLDTAATQYHREDEAESKDHELDVEISKIMASVGDESPPYLRDLVFDAIKHNVQVYFVDLSTEHFVEIVTARSKAKYVAIDTKTIDFMLSISGMTLRNEKIAKEMIKRIDPASDKPMEYVLLIGSDHVSGVKGERYTVQKQLENRLQSEGIEIKVSVFNETSGQIEELTTARVSDQKLRERIEKFQADVVETAKVKAELAAAEERFGIALKSEANLFGDYDVDPQEVKKELEEAMMGYESAKLAVLNLLGDFTT